MDHKMSSLVSVCYVLRFQRLSQGDRWFQWRRDDSIGRNGKVTEHIGHITSQSMALGTTHSCAQLERVCSSMVPRLQSQVLSVCK